MRYNNISYIFYGDLLYIFQNYTSHKDELKSLFIRQGTSGKSNFWAGGSEIWEVQGRSILERLEGDMSFYSEEDYGGCGTEESYGHKHLQGSLVWELGKFTPQAKKAFVGVFLTVRSAVDNLPEELITDSNNNSKLAEAINDNSKFFANKYAKEADIIVKAIEKKLRSSDTFAFFIHESLQSEREKFALHGFTYRFAFGENILEYTKQNSPNKAKTAVKNKKQPKLPSM
jgi:hypothetical protein